MLQSFWKYYLHHNTSLAISLCLENDHPSFSINTNNTNKNLSELSDSERTTSNVSGVQKAVIWYESRDMKHEGKQRLSRAALVTTYSWLFCYIVSVLIMEQTSDTATMGVIDTV